MRWSGQTALVPRDAHRLYRPRPLTTADSRLILRFPSTQRKEVIQCLTPSAVTSLGSPARLVLGLASGRSQPWTSELRKLGRDGSNSVASFLYRHCPMCNCTSGDAPQREPQPSSFQGRRLAGMAGRRPERRPASESPESRILNSINYFPNYRKIA
jgi:hypothetical protein